MPILNDWVASAAGSGEPAPRIYKQGGRAWLAGTLIAGSALVSFANPLCQLPDAYLPHLLGDDSSDWDFTATCFANGSALGTVSVAIKAGHLVVSHFVGISEGDLVYLDGVSWPLAA